MYIDIHALVYAYSTIPLSWTFADGNRHTTHPISFTFYYIRAGQRHILFDAGCDTMEGWDTKDFITPCPSPRADRYTHG